MSLQAPRGTFEPEDMISSQIDALTPWFHNLHLPSGHQTAAGHPLGDFPAFKWRQIAGVLDEDLTGLRALDVGCNAGFYSFALAARGAEVLAIDSDEHYLQQGRWAAAQLDPAGRVRFERMHLYDLAGRREQFDIVLFLGVLYHLRYPQLALDLLAPLVRGRIIVQTLTMPGEAAGEAPRQAAREAPRQAAREAPRQAAGEAPGEAPGEAAGEAPGEAPGEAAGEAPGEKPDVIPDDLPFDERGCLAAPGWPRAAFIERSFAGDQTNWWAPDDACVRAMLRSAGLRIVSAPAHETYVCEREDPECDAARELRSAELAAATGGRAAGAPPAGA